MQRKIKRNNRDGEDYFNFIERKRNYKDHDKLNIESEVEEE